MTKIGNKSNKEKCARYRANMTREKNKARKMAKRAKHLAKLAAKRMENTAKQKCISVR